MSSGTDLFDSTDAVRRGGALPHARTAVFDGPVPLELGGELPRIVVAYETWGTLSPARDNAVLVCHAISGDSHAARHSPDDEPGWWDTLVGPGKPLDTDRLLVVCANVLGGCRGTTGPGDLDPRTGRRFGADFPEITVGDIADTHVRLLDHLNIERLLGVVGGSMGGQQALALATRHAGRVAACVVMASAPRLTSQALAFDVVGRNAILRDPHFHGGQYYDKPTKPAVGLALARMLGHITYLSRDGMTSKFDPVRDRPRDVQSDFEVLWGVGSYLAYQGDKFVERFDANTYVTLTRAMDRFDLGDSPEALEKRFREQTSPDTRFGLVSFSSDWLFPPDQSRAIVEALSHADRRVSYLEITSDLGHDAFLLPQQADQYGGFAAALLGLWAVTDDTRTPAAGDAASQTRLFDAHRLDYDVILDLVPRDARVLDLGCGDGDLLALLAARGESRRGGLVGVEVQTPCVLRTAARGFDVIDTDLNRPLTAFADGQFDVVVLSKTLQSLDNTVGVLEELLRVGRLAVVSFPNFGHEPLRKMLADEGRSPKSPGVYAHEWYDTPNRRYPTILDFLDLCRARGIAVDAAVYLDTASGRRIDPAEDFNLHADLAVMRLTRAVREEPAR